VADNSETSIEMRSNSARFLDRMFCADKNFAAGCARPREIQAMALAFGCAVSILRMAVGAHFFTDVFFAGFFAFVVIWLLHGCLYRWRATRISDVDLERVVERMRLKRA
jgi:membrane-associated phospholipid phosphatase